MTDRTSWSELREELGVDRTHHAYEAARIAFELGAEVRTLREERGWTQTELAERAGMTQSAMARLEAGGTIPTLPFLERVAAALQMRLSIALSPA
ncbi:helix-turn-helix transcriptional regulator [Amycolatopsis sp. SID8362]|uniref:helix-turn-helix domain-containing protein n=1 Tax=Amycolatopsis sp. SID8362 TaxID=2690346 RepID=UPI0013722655|nr:helix-turn-helix transcriptional regulator [Amycolatopsis sp. SID8362]NBH02538.1 helix-turn-helix domain-containing protein [Amycolatopsis sp. SID8362]NED39242.1 helix-turn-helix transcriptional regulator [Amycolatopsis sp. SID8362]